MNRITKLFALVIASTLATSSVFANYPTSAPGQNPSNYPAYSEQGQNDPAPDMGGEHPYTGHYSGRPQYGRPGQMMRGDAGYHPQGGYNAGYEAGAPQSYQIDENYPNAPRSYRSQGYAPRGYSGYQGYQGYNDTQENGNHPQNYSREEGHSLKHDGDTQHPVYEYMLGKDGKWHNVAAPSKWSNSNNEVGLNDQGMSGQPMSGQPQNSGDKANPEYSANQFPNTPRYDSASKDATDDPSPSGMGRRNTPSNPNANWSSDEGLDQSTGSSSPMRRNIQR